MTSTTITSARHIKTIKLKMTSATITYDTHMPYKRKKLKMNSVTTTSYYVRRIKKTKLKMTSATIRSHILTTVVMIY